MTIEELHELENKEQARQASLENRIHCCTAAGCLSCGAESVRLAIGEEIEKRGLGERVEVCGTGCMGMCSRGPLVLASGPGKLYGGLTAADAPAVLDASRSLAAHEIDRNGPFFTRQQRIVLAGSGRVDPEKLADYIGAAAIARSRRRSRK